ncbi:amino acid ABC transporter ATP-binding protein [Paenibacillus herberti]|uniref:Ectoine/hydroxyectoine ABC transporter ATP-binding protein EhuA n=1 Tax=Paenibacillus herberti TaxID=1619309 RepID=A0A229NZR8_9BACL|nr:amino acid ABC transporter ATP-binding protein [Paenibacillus herberti]OXM15129.1 ectoine/hydroxyectoine ABC transporter ATP-binding protein EhuA [Paenibacillus herberti]
MIEINNLHKSFGSLEVLKGIDLTLEKGKVLAIIGPSGSGKTTLLRCFNLLEVPDQGMMKIGEMSLQFQQGNGIRTADTLALRKRTGMVFQSFNLFPHMTAIQNIMEAQVTVQGKSKAAARSRAAELLGKVGLGDKADAYPHQLSGGQQQRIAIARAMALDPDVLLFDEPTSALDPELVGDVLKVIRQLAAEGMTMVIVTHEMRFAENVADHIVMMDGGVIVESGPPEQVIGNPRSPRAIQFLNRVTNYDVT